MGFSKSERSGLVALLLVLVAVVSMLGTSGFTYASNSAPEQNTSLSISPPPTFSVYSSSTSTAPTTSVSNVMVYGKVYGQCGEATPVPVGGATVTVTGSLGETSTTQSDAFGSFSFSLLPGEYTITASATNYNAESLSLTVTGGGPIMYWSGFILTQTACNTLSQITITSSVASSWVSIPMQIDAATVGTPQTYSWIPGSTHVLIAPTNPVTQGVSDSPVCPIDCFYLFQYWTSPSVGSVYSSEFNYPVPSSSETVTAVYETCMGSPCQTSTQTSTTTVTTPPNGEQITINSNPPSQSIISVDGNSIDTPQIYTWAIGSTHYLVSPTTAPGLNCGACQYTFLYWWSTSGRQQNATTFVYTVPTYSETVSAYYQLVTTTSTTSASTTTTTSSTTTSATTATQQAGGADFALSVSPSSVSLPPGNFVGFTSFTLMLSSVGGWSEQVQFTTSALPQGITLSNMPASYQLTSSAWWSVAVNIAASAQSGNYQLVITGLSGSLIHSAVETVSVSSPTTAVPEFPSSALLGLLAACFVFVSVAVRRRRG